MPPRLLSPLGTLGLSLIMCGSATCRAIAREDPLPPEAVARLGSFRLLHGASIASVAFSPDGKVLASGGGWGRLLPKEAGRTTTSDRRICLWDAATGEKIRELSAPEDVISCVAFSLDGKQLAAGCGSMVCVWRVKDGKELGRHEGHEEDVCLVQFAPDGKTIFFGEEGGIVHLWEPGGRRTVREWKPWKGAAPRLANGEAAESVSAFALSSDGKLLIWGIAKWVEANGGEKRKRDRAFLRFGDVSSGRIARDVEIQRVPERIVFSEDSRHFAIACPGVSIWQSSTGRLLREPFRTIFADNDRAFTPDGHTLVAMRFNRDIERWDFKTEKDQPTITYRHYFRDFAGSKRSVFTYSPDGKTLAISNGTGLLLWDVEANREKRLCPGHRGPIEEVSFSADGRSLATRSRTVVCQWTTRDWKEAGRVELWRKPAPDEFLLAVSPGGQHYVTQWDGKDVRVRETTTNRLLRTLPAGPWLFSSGVFSPNGQKLLLWEQGGGGGDNLASVCYDLTGEGRRRAITFPDCVRAPVFSPDNATVAHFAQDGTIHITDVVRGLEVCRIDEELPRHRLPDPLNGFRSQAIFSPKGDRLIVAPTGEFSADAPSHDVRFWDVKTGREVRRLTIPLRDGEAGAIMGMAMSPDGRTLAIGQFGDPVIRLWEVATGTQYRQLAGHRDTVLALAFSPDGRTLVSGSADCTALVWDLSLPSRWRRGELTPAGLASLWDDLSADPRRADEAIRILAYAPERSVPFLRDRVHPVAAVPPDRMRRLLGDLDSNDFDTRDRAARELERLTDRVADDLKKRLSERMSLEVRRRVEGILKQRESERPPLETLHALRVVACLELAGTVEAREAIESLSRGVPGAWLTREARDARERLRRR